ncbi:hypothetical protein [Leekyejoonella antrihumi]|uniref:hypothetical protein n=1 Tax=Leekyejoonella antrihumi TaxID=1660198 RepID=UPI001648142C|nr:hypothetical protein [Leekyejoonella antrihumi]
MVIFAAAADLAVAAEEPLVDGIDVLDGVEAAELDEALAAGVDALCPAPVD